MNTRIHGKHVFECDLCSEVLDTEQREWSSAFNVFREAGWQSAKVDDGHRHHCPACKDKQ